MKRYHVRFYRLKDSPDEKASWFEHDIVSETEADMMWKVNSIVHNHEVNGGRIFKTKVVWIREEPPKEKRCARRKPQA